MRRGVRLTAVALAWCALVMGAVPAQALVPRIVNGTEAPVGEFGFTVAVLDSARLARDGAFEAQKCVGALTTPTTVVTAAHCMVDERTGRVAQPTEVSIGVGRALRAPDFRIIDVSEVAVHPDYDIETTWSDLAVLTLAVPVTDVAPITPMRPTDLPSYVAPGAAAVVAGWGSMLRTGVSYPDALRIGEVTVFPDRTCGSGASFTLGGLTFTGFRSDEADPAVMLCAAGVTTQGAIIDACQGDSGGPLVGGSGAAMRLIGVVSWGEDCATIHPGVYTRMSAMTDFLVAEGAIATLAPTIAPSILVEPLDASVRVTFTPASDGSQVTTYAATALDPATGAVASCYATPRRDRLPPFCTIGGLTNGMPVVVRAIVANALGDSPASAPQTATPLPVPTAGRITRVTVRDGGSASFVVSPSRSTAAPLTSVRVVCLPVRGGPGRSARVDDGRATITGLKPIRHACSVVARSSVGRGTSNPRAVLARR